MALKARLYKMRLVDRQRTLFNDYSYSDHWHLFAKAMDDDVSKHRTLKFVHPKDKGKEYIRHYYSMPVNGHALLALGQYKNEMDFTYVWVVLRPTYFKEPYLVLGNNSRSVRNPDLLADMVASAFNWVLKDSGVELVMEPWDPKEERDLWYKDFSDSYENEANLIECSDLEAFGYEDALELVTRTKLHKAKNAKKNDNIRVYFRVDDFEKLLQFLHRALKGQKVAKDIARPFRLLYDLNLTDHIPYKAVMKEFPEVEGLLTERRYNDWTNKFSTSYDGDPIYEKLKESLNI
jgi:Ca2+-binding EF-hand superfamily protein